MLPQRVCVCVSPEALWMQSQAFHSKHGHWSEELEQLRRSWERRCSVAAARQEEAELPGALLKANTTSERRKSYKNHSYTKVIDLVFICWGIVIVTWL